MLEEMSKEPNGSILVMHHHGMSETELGRLHHVELLCDAGLTHQKSDSNFRITNTGYDFLGAINRDRTINFSKFKKLLQDGIELAEAVRRLIDFANGIS